MEIKLDKEKTEKLIQAYYKEHEGREVSARLVSELSECGPITHLELEENLETLGVEMTAVERHSRKYLVDVFATVFDDMGYNLDSLEVLEMISDTGDAYCDGIKVGVRKKIKLKESNLLKGIR